MMNPMITKTYVTHALRAILWAGALTAVLAVLGYSESEARTYRVVDVRTKVAQGNWDLASDSTITIHRQESYGGQWALEQRPIANGRAVTQLLDESNKIIWEDQAGDLSLLSSSAPAFVVASKFNLNRPVYNLNIGSDPVYTVAVGVSGEPFQSRDGAAFGFAARPDAVNIVSIKGELLGYAQAAKPMRVVAAAIANKGKYAVIAERRYRPSLGEWQQQISLLDGEGEAVGRIGKEAESNEPQCLALSADDPPRIAVGTAHGVSFWSPKGDALWRDSTAFGSAAGNLTIQAMYVTDDGRVLALTAAKDNTATLWAWDDDGKPEAKLELPAEFDTSVNGADFLGADDSSVTLQSFGQILTVAWTDD